MNRSSRREEAPINFGFRISDFEKRASYSENGIGGNARPHPAFAGRSQSGHLQQNCYGGRRPGPLPQERGKHAQFPEFSRPLVWNCFMGTYVGCYGSWSQYTRKSKRPPLEKQCSMLE